MENLKAKGESIPKESIQDSTPSPSSERWSIQMEVEPTAKGRARAGKYGHFTPGKTRMREEEIRYWLIQAGAPKFEGAVKVNMGFGFARPKSVSKKKRPYHVVKPDLTNLAKLVEDAANTILWHDDSQIASMTIYKFYVPQDERPFIILQVEPIK